jgi:hypothetical protein
LYSASIFKCIPTAKSDSLIKKARADHYVMTEIGCSRLVKDTLTHAAASIPVIRNPERFLTRLLEMIFDFIPADRGGVPALEFRPASPLP